MIVASTATLSLTRSFRFVPHGERAPATDGPTISCDGRVPGCTLELTHWTDNATPDHLYADTSTECALRLARACARGEHAALAHATVLNNHFDTDGVLSVWACLEPEAALAHAELLAEGAAAGDFGEWSSPRGARHQLPTWNGLVSPKRGMCARGRFRKCPPPAVGAREHAVHRRARHARRRAAGRGHRGDRRVGGRRRRCHVRGGAGGTAGTHCETVRGACRASLATAGRLSVREAAPVVARGRRGDG